MMTAVEQNNIANQKESAADQQTSKKARNRQSDDGPDVLPCMEHFVTLARKVKRPALILTLVERAADTTLPEIAALVEVAKGVLAIPARKALFHAVAKLMPDKQQRIERAAELVVLLDDEYGAQAVQSLLEEKNEGDAAVLVAPTDRYSRALHLHLLQEFPSDGVKAEHRFEHAERLQVMHRQWKSENFSSHYLGPKGIEPKVDVDVQDVLRTRIAALYPKVAADQILIEQFTRRDLAHADRCGGEDADDSTPVLLHTLTATFNGSTAHFKQVADGEVIDHEEPAAMSAIFSWEPGTGALGVFCEDKESRRDLATIFRDVVLACEGAINDMPMREFDVGGEEPESAAAPVADAITARTLEIAALLQTRGAAIHACDLNVSKWAETGVTDAQILAALKTAQQRRAEACSDQPIGSGYLNTIITDPKAPAWWSSDDLMSDMAADLGIPGARPGESRDDFRARITAAMATAKAAA